MSTPTALTATPYPLVYRHLGRGRVGDLLRAEVRLGFVTAAYTPAAADEWWAGPRAAEAYGAGYAAGGLALPNSTFDTDAATGRAVLGCDPLVITGAGFTVRWCVLFVSTGDPASSPLLSYVDLGAELSPAGADLPLSFPSGVFRIGPAAAV